MWPPTLLIPNLSEGDYSLIIIMHKSQQLINMINIEGNKTREINKRAKKERVRERPTWITKTEEEILQQSSI